MSPRRTRRGTIRESINESSTLSASKILRKTRSRVNKSRTKGSEEDSDSPVDINNIVTNDSTATTSFLNDTSISTRKRRRKQEPGNQNNTLSVTVNESQTSRKKSSKNAKGKKQTRSNKSQVVDASSIISEDESFSKKQTGDKSQMQDLISEDEETEERVLRKKIRFDNQSLSSSGKMCKTPEKISQKTSDADITPKSSPLNVSFTPNRSIKTPRKSPDNLGSPKTHSHDSLKFLNVPRKLSIVDSPPSSENSLQQSNGDIKTDGSKSKNHKSPKASSQKKSTSPTLAVRPKFSKSPKIVFKTPKSKSNKKSPRKTSTSVTVKKSPNISKSPSPTKSTKVLSSPAKSAKSQKNISPSKLIEKTLEVSLGNSTESSEQDLINQSQKLSKINSSIESKISLTSPLSSSKSKITPSQSKGISKVLSSFKSKKSPKFISPLSSNKTPKIVLTLKSKKSPAKSSKSITPSKVKKSPVKLGKSISASKIKKSPVKTNKNISPSKIKKSPVKTNKSISPSKAKKSPVKASKSISPSKARKFSETMTSSKSEKIIKSPRKSTGNNSSLKNTELSPRVIVNKLSSSQLDSSSLRSKTKQPTINLIPVDHTLNKKVLIRKSKSPKTPKQTMIKSLTPASTSKIQINKSINRLTENLKNSTPADLLDKRLVNLKPSNTSTPRELKKRVTNKVLSLNLSNNSAVFNGSRQPKSKAIKRLNDQSKNASNCKLLDDESEPFMNDSSLIHMSDVFDDDGEPSEKNSTFEIDKSDVNTPRRSERNSNTSETNNKNDTLEVEKNNSRNSKSGRNNTYELEYPKTPALKNKTTKRTLDQTEIGKEGEQESKKNVKVHFASPTKENQGRSSTINRIGTPAHAIQQKRTSASVRTPTNKALVNKIERKRISSVMTPQSRISSGSAIKRRSISVSDSISQTRKSIRDTQIASINRLSKPKVSVNSENKLAVKTPVAKKIPNFSEIHKKNFAKMESIVDLKKRVENRHVTLNSASSAKKVPGSGNNPTPVDSTNGSYNRFGFKLRKNEAINIISKKQTNAADTREKKRENARSALKGVRMNRRFELQMKSRTQNS